MMPASLGCPPSRAIGCKQCGVNEIPNWRVACDDRIERRKHLDVGVEVQHAAGRAQQVSQRERFHRGREFHHVVEGRHVLETFWAKVDVGDRQQSAVGTLAHLHLQRIVGYNNEEGGPRVMLNERVGDDLRAGM